MKLGYFTFPVHPKNSNVNMKLEEDAKAIILADKLGCSEAFVGEHLTDEHERITSSLLFLSTLIHRTKNIKLATGTINLPHSHPAQVASNISMFDHISKGRLIMGIGPGSLLSDMEAFETLEKNRNEMFLEAIDQILKIWKKKPPYNLKGKYWNISTKKTYDKKIAIGSFLKNYQKPYPEIVCTSLSRNKASIKSLTLRGWNLLSSNFLQNESLKFHYAGIKAGIDRRNFSHKINWRVARKIFVNEKKMNVQKYVFSTSSPYYLTLVQIMKKLKKYNRLDILKKNPDDKKEKLEPMKLLQDLVICGCHKTVSEKLLQLRNDIGNFNTITYVGIDWKNKELAKNSITLMATKVMENLRMYK